MSGDYVERLRAWRAFASQNRPGYDHMRDVSYDKAPVCDADLDAALDELERLRDQRAADDLWARTAAELLAAVAAPTCTTDHYGNCSTHGVLVLEAGSQCPHVLARAFLSSSRLHLADAAPQPERDGGGS